MSVMPHVTLCSPQDKLDILTYFVTTHPCRCHPERSEGSLESDCKAGREIPRKLGMTPEGEQLPYF